MDQNQIMADMLASGAGPGGGAPQGAGAPPSPAPGDPIAEATTRLAQKGITPESAEMALAEAQQVIADIQMVQQAMGGGAPPGGAPPPDAGGMPPQGMPPVA